MKMSGNNRVVSISGIILLFIVLLNVVIAKHAFTVNTTWYWALLVTLPLLMLAIFYSRQKKRYTNNKVVRKKYVDDKLLPVKQQHIQSCLN